MRFERVLVVKTRVDILPDSKLSYVRVGICLSGVCTVCRVVLCRARPLIRGTGTTGEARETGAPLIVGGGAAAEERGLAKNNVSPRRTKIHTCAYTHTDTQGKEYTAYIYRRCTEQPRHGILSD